MLMRINKEYPATHSMSTAWYVANKDGNVAIMNFEDKGPVPWKTIPKSIMPAEMSTSEELLFSFLGQESKLMQFCS